MLGQRIAALRKQKGLSQYELAERLNFSRGKLANYEQGSRQPDYDSLLKIAEFFEVTTDYLLGKTDQPDGFEDKIPLDEEDQEFLAFVSNPEVKHFFKELSESPEERFQELRRIWEILKEREAGRKPGDKQN